MNEEKRQPVESPTVQALREGMVVGLANHRLVEKVKDFARVQACLAHSLLLLIRSESVPSVAVSITPTAG